MTAVPGQRDTPTAWGNQRTDKSTSTTPGSGGLQKNTYHTHSIHSSIANGPDILYLLAYITSAWWTHRPFVHTVPIISDSADYHPNHHVTPRHHKGKPKQITHTQKTQQQVNKLWTKENNLSWGYREHTHTLPLQQRQAQAVGIPILLCTKREVYFVQGWKRGGDFSQADYDPSHKNK